MKTNNASKEIVAVWRRHEEDFKHMVKEIKKQQTSIPDQSELNRLITEATLAYKSMKAINEISKTERQNVENFCKMNYRKQLRASHLKIIDKMKKYNEVIRDKSPNTIKY